MPNATVKISLLLSTFFGIGYIPGPTGTYGSAATILLYWGLSSRIHNVSAWLQIGFLLALTTLAIFVSQVAAQVRGDPDPGIVIIDEVVGQLVALMFVPINATNVVIAFFLFRLFDIVKPFPVRQLEHLKGGFGIVLDDVGAGIYANIVLQISIKLFLH